MAGGMMRVLRPTFSTVPSGPWRTTTLEASHTMGPRATRTFPRAGPMTRWVRQFSQWAQDRKPGVLWWGAVH